MSGSGPKFDVRRGSPALTLSRLRVISSETWVDTQEEGERRKLGECSKRSAEIGVLVACKTRHTSMARFEWDFCVVRRMGRNDPPVCVEYSRKIKPKVESTSSFEL